MNFCDERIQKHLLSGGKVKRPFFISPVYYNDSSLVFSYDNKEKVYCLNKIDLVAYDWEIVEPEYDWDKIIKDKVLCVFSDYEDFRTFDISTLIKINLNNNTYRTNDNIVYGYCKLFNPNDFNIAKDLKEYEE